ncbi:MAG TPA: tetratricopeptide repeat protein [Thermoanaerobaculia bacterium]|nr:tetratricopeptide repeat protein [Thermoanaerobaculia bacterium]
MNRENILFASCGFLLGLILGGVMIGPKIHEWRTPARGAATTPDSAAPSQPAASSAEASGGAAMSMVRQQIDGLRKRIAANPRDARAFVELGNLYMDAAKFPQAIEFYEKSLQIERSPSVEMDLGICYRETRAFDRSLALFREIARETPANWQARFNEAIVLADMGNLGAASAVIATLRQERPDDANIVRFEQTLAAARKQQTP